MEDNIKIKTPSFSYEPYDKYYKTTCIFPDGKEEIFHIEGDLNFYKYQQLVKACNELNIDVNNLKFQYGRAVIEIKGKGYNYMCDYGEILCPDLWFDKAWDFDHCLGEVIINEKYNLLKLDGSLLFPDIWFRYIQKINRHSHYWEVVTDDDKRNIVDSRGYVLPDISYDRISYDESNDTIIVIHNKPKTNIIKDRKLLFPDKWIDDIYYGLHLGYFRIELDGKYTLINRNGDFPLPDMWFDSIENIEGNDRVVLLYDKSKGYNFLSEYNGYKLCSDIWLDKIYPFEGKIQSYLYIDEYTNFAKVELNGHFNYISGKGKLIFPFSWFDFIEITGPYNDYIHVKIDDVDKYAGIDNILDEYYSNGQLKEDSSIMNETSST